MHIAGQSRHRDEIGNYGDNINNSKNRKFFSKNLNCKRLTKSTSSNLSDILQRVLRIPCRQ